MHIMALHYTDSMRGVCIKSTQICRFKHNHPLAPQIELFIIYCFARVKRSSYSLVRLLPVLEITLCQLKTNAASFVCSFGSIMHAVKTLDWENELKLISLFLPGYLFALGPLLFVSIFDVWLMKFTTNQAYAVNLISVGVVAFGCTGTDWGSWRMGTALLKI